MKRYVKKNLKLIGLTIFVVVVSTIAVVFMLDEMVEYGASEWSYTKTCEQVASDVSEMGECVEVLRTNLTPEKSRYLSACNASENLETLYDCVGLSEEDL